MKSFLRTVRILPIFLLFFQSVSGKDRTRDPVRLPEIPGYTLLACDLHLHTVFSDGAVWPSVRVDEAWRNGLDVIAVTDHLEYNPHQKDVVLDNNRPYDIALESAAMVGLTVIRGAEITRKMPPGHFNAIFLSDANLLRTEDWRDAFREAEKQKAFIFWNHPGWKGQQPDGKARWYPEHTELLEKGLFQGIEIVNEYDYYPEAHAWCLEKNLAMLGNSDIHDPVDVMFDYPAGEHRPMTFVLVRQTGLEGIREALNSCRTVVYWKDKIIGREEFLKPLFEGSIRWERRKSALKKWESVHIPITNDSDIDVFLSLAGREEGFFLPGFIKVPANRTVLFEIKRTSGEGTGMRKIRIPYKVANYWIAPEQGMPVTFEFEVGLE
ncbi:histidinol-phosphatase [bacterium]|nr:histidinol-phosphatase [bacterium]